MSEKDYKADFIEHIRLSPEFSKTQRILRYIFALAAIAALILLPIIGHVGLNGDIFAIAYTVLITGYVFLFMKHAGYYLLNTSIYNALIRPYVFFSAWCDLIKQNNMYWFKLFDAFFALLPIALIAISYVLRPIIAVLMYHD